MSLKRWLSKYNSRDVDTVIPESDHRLLMFFTAILPLYLLYRYEGGYHAGHPVIRRFWEVVHDMDTESQRKLLMFVTGSMKAPVSRWSYVVWRKLNSQS